MKEISRNLGRGAVLIKKHSPNILIVSGFAGVIGSFIWAIMQAEKQVKMCDIRDRKIIEYTDESGNISKDILKEVKIEYAANIARIYAGPVLLLTVSLAGIGLSHKIMSGRNAALTVALTAIQEKFQQYRARIREEYGEEKEEEIMKGKKTVIMDKDGGIEEIKFENGLTVFSKVFDENCEHYTKDPEANRVTILGIQNYFNNRLVTWGHVFLNEVYDELGFPRTETGSLYGWVYNEKEAPDGHIDFGIYNLRNQPKAVKDKKVDFINGYERSIWLDFNVDGLVYNKI